jgi:hypothetical protein
VNQQDIEHIRDSIREQRLPNAASIEAVMYSFYTYPMIWRDAFDAVWPMHWASERTRAWLAARSRAGYIVDTHLLWTTPTVVEDAALALAAYDDAGQFLSMSSERLRIWKELSEHPAATLLLPAVLAMERIQQRVQRARARSHQEA